MQEMLVGRETAPEEESSCFLCNETSDRIVWREGRYSAHVCPSCELVYTDPKPRLGEFDPRQENHRDSFYSISAQYKARWISQACARGRLLEIGCGKGHFLNEARKLGFEVCGVEPEPGRARFAEERYGLTIIQTLLEDLDIPDSSFDVVYHCDLLAHLRDPLASLARMQRLLRPGGVLCFEMGIMGGISPLWYRYLGEIGLGPHLWFYSHRSFELLLQKAGLVPTRIQHFSLVPFSVLSRAPSFVINRILVPLCSASRFELLPSPEGLHMMNDKIKSYLRYSGGAMFPGTGPKTLFVVARPGL